MHIKTITTKLIIPAALFLVIGGGAIAAAELKFMAQAKKFDPGHTDQVLQAQWMGGMGVNGGQGLILNMASTVPYPPGASADATIMGVGGHMLNSLAFDHKTDTACTGGAPRWSVETDDGGSYAFGCASGTHTDLGNGWEHIVFSDADVQVLGGPAWPGFASAPTITFLQVLQDEAGSTTLDNLQVGIDGSTYVFGKPGAMGPQ